MQTTTLFDASRHHIHVALTIDLGNGESWDLDAILDTGAPRTELSASFLRDSGLWQVGEPSDLTDGLETQKLAQVVLPSVNVCGHTMKDLRVTVSEFASSWGIGALVGLDFFRLARVTIDFAAAHIIVGMSGQ